MTRTPSSSQRGSFRSLRPRFTLRKLLAVVTLFCIWLGMYMHRAERQKRAVAFHTLRGNKVTYDFQRYPIGENADLLLPNSSPWPSWLLNGLGVDFFHTVVEIDIRDLDHLSDLQAFSRLTVLHTTGDAINDSDIRHVAKLRQLRELHVAGCYDPFETRLRSDLTDQSLESLAAMPCLEKLYIGGTFTCAGLTTLATSRSLRHIAITGCDESVTTATADVFWASQHLEHITLRKWPRPLSHPVQIGPSPPFPPALKPRKDDGLVVEWYR